MARVALIGVGLMGHGIAANLLRHGHELRLFEHPGNQPVDDLLAAGATSTADAAALVADTEVLMLCVTGSPQVEAIMLGQNGLAAKLRAGMLVVDCSTALPESTVRVAEAVSAAGAAFVDAAMTRTPKEAAEGRLNLLVGGDDAAFARCRPLLECFAENIVHGGPVGAGHRLKLLHNFVSLGQMAVLAEAFACARRSGIDGTVLADVLASGGGGGAALQRIRPFVEHGDASSVRFSMSNAGKDIGYYTTMAGQAGAPAGIAAAIGQTFDKAAERDPAAPVPELVARLAGD
jgi:3-hydroxyisobutyrate dehydrogenase-like beta-hydroxyacid dehydrogenase